MANVVTDPWCKMALITMIKKEYTVNDVSEGTGFTPQHTSAIVHGRNTSKKGRRVIADFLGIRDDYGKKKDHSG